MNINLLLLLISILTNITWRWNSLQPLCLFFRIVLSSLWGWGVCCYVDLLVCFGPSVAPVSRQVCVRAAPPAGRRRLRGPAAAAAAACRSAPLCPLLIRASHRSAYCGGATGDDHMSGWDKQSCTVSLLWRFLISPFYDFKKTRGQFERGT